MVEFTTTVGRIVWGNPAKSRPKTDQNTKQPILKDGKPVEQWSFGVAYPKAEFAANIWPYMAKEAANGYPQGTPPKFAWKYVDGDGVDGQGVPFANREGYAGCIVLSISTEAYAPPIYKFNAQTGQYLQLSHDQIKCGDYVAVGLNIKVNVPTDRTHTPGLYVNPTAVEHVGYGQEILNGPDPMAIFAKRQHALPPGASATPLAPAAGVGMPMQPGMMPQQPMQPGMMPQQPMQPGMMPVVPAHDFVQNAGMQPMQQPGMQPSNGMPFPGPFQGR